MVRTAREETPMTEYHARIFWILIFLFSLPPVHGAWAGSPTDQLRAGIDRVFQILGDPQLEGDAQLKQRRTAIVTVANEIFDFGEMAKQSLGQFWAQRTLAERGEFVHLFTRVVQHSYISNVDQRGVGKMTVQGEVVDGEYAVVRTKLPLSSGRVIPIDYRMHSTDDRWRVYDLSVEGISLVANYRAQFNKIIRTSSYEALVWKFKLLQAESSVPSTATEQTAP
jgi:phospholipid transport system substrate-binding protein